MENYKNIYQLLENKYFYYLYVNQKIKKEAGKARIKKILIKFNQ
jgi:SOS response regulatory protein OraA/RecX